MTRSERVQRISELRAEGLTHRQIGERLGIARSTVADYVSDPSGTKTRARKTRSNGVCADCGGPTKNGGGVPPERCHVCAPAASRQWTDNLIINAIQRWAAAHDGQPPSATDWNSDYRGADYPCTTTVVCVFGSWGAAIAVAGFARPRIGHYGRPGDDPAQVAEAVRLYASGMSMRAVHAATGVGARALGNGLARAGIPARPPGRRAA